VSITDMPLTCQHILKSQHIVPIVPYVCRGEEEEEESLFKADAVNEAYSSDSIHRILCLL